MPCFLESYIKYCNVLGIVGIDTYFYEDPAYNLVSWGHLTILSFKVSCLNWAKFPSTLSRLPKSKVTMSRSPLRGGGESSSSSLSLCLFKCFRNTLIC